MIPEVGKRVKLTSDVIKFPHFIAEKGKTGTIDEWTKDMISVKMDEHMEGAETWDNCVHFYIDEMLAEYLEDEKDEGI